MALAPSATLATQDAIRALAMQLDAAPHGRRGPLIDAAAQQMNWSRQSVYRKLQTIGWSSGRRRRADAGTTTQDEQALMTLASARLQAVRKNGKATLATTTARSILAQNGYQFRVGNARLNTLMRARHLDIATQKRGKTAQAMRSNHPNHVHQVDPSLCLLYYAPNGEQRVLHDDEIYKNKPQWVEKVGALKCWRYVLTDHYSSTIRVRYYAAAGESTANLYDFLLWCWRRDSVDGCPMHGVPRLLVWDKGSANSAHSIRCALRALDVEPWAHRAKNPNGKGQVEGANNVVECQFESRLKFEPVASVDELNAAAEAWQVAYNANRIPGYDSRLKRRGMRQPTERFGLWQMIREGQLRRLPDDETCRHILTKDPEVRHVRADLSVTYRHPAVGRSLQYDLRHLPEVYPRATVRVSPLVYGNAQLLVRVEGYDGEERAYAVDPVPVDEMSGQRLDASSWADDPQSLPDTVVDRARKQADRAAYPGMNDQEIERAKGKNKAPFGGLDAHSHLAGVSMPAYMQRRGNDLDVPNPVAPKERQLSAVAIARALMARMGDGWPADGYQQIVALHPDGAPEGALDEIETALRAPQWRQPTLRVMAGGKAA